MINEAPKMQRRHFEYIAMIINKLPPTISETQRKQVAHLFAWELRVTNPQFDTKKFIEACTK